MARALSWRPNIAPAHDREIVELYKVDQTYALAEAEQRSTNTAHRASYLRQIINREALVHTRREHEARSASRRPYGLSSAY